MRYPYLSSEVYGIPLMIAAEKAAIIDAVLRAPSGAAGGERAADVAFAPQDDRRTYRVTSGGVGVLPVVGSLVQRTHGLNPLSGLRSYQSIAADAEAMLADPSIRAIMLELDSSGGQAAGVFELAHNLRRRCAAAGKLLWAHANESALSAAYALACAADHVSLPATGTLGSIGVIALHVDQSAKNAKDGYAYTLISAGSKKAFGSPHAPLSDEARSELQARVNELYDHFVAHVAAQRGLAEQAVRDQEAGVFVGQAAVAAGLANAVMSFNEALAALEARVSARPAFSAVRSLRRQSIRKGAAMDNEAVAELLSAEQVAAQLAAARKEGAESMQARIRAIMECDEAAGRDALARHLAFNTSMSVDEAKALLAVSAKEAPPSAASQVNALAEAMAKLANPTVGADAPPADLDGRAHVASLWQRSNQKLSLVK